MAGTTDRATLHRELQQAMKTAEKESEVMIYTHCTHVPCT